VSQTLLASSSPRSCVTTSLGSNMLDFSNTTVPPAPDLKNHHSDNSSEVSNKKKPRSPICRIYIHIYTHVLPFFLCSCSWFHDLAFFFLVQGNSAGSGSAPKKARVQTSSSAQSTLKVYPSCPFVHAILEETRF
jgi:hypothetical protein